MKRLFYSLTALTFLMFHYIAVNAQSYNMPSFGGKAVYTTCTGNFYDAGGPSGIYNPSSMYESDTITFYPGTAGLKLSLTFNTISTYQTDVLRVYDSENAFTTPIAYVDWSFSVPYTVTATNASGALTFVLESYMSADGWAATISCVGGSLANCVSIGAPVNGGVGIDPNTVTLSWSSDSNASGYTLYHDNVDGTSWFANTSNTYYSLGGLDTNTTYYWRVVPYDMFEVSAAGCPTWSFTTASPTLSITTPSAGEVLVTESSYYIYWNSSSGIGSVDLFYSLDNGTNWSPIYYSIANYTGTNSYYWYPSFVGDYPNSLIKIVNSSDTTIKTISQPFTLTSTPLAFVSPVKTDEFTVNNVVNVVLNNKLSSPMTYAYLYNYVNGSYNGYQNIAPISQGTSSFPWQVTTSGPNSFMLEYYSNGYKYSYSDTFLVNGPPSCVSYISPYYQTGIGLNPTLKWTTTPYATKYLVYLRNSNTYEVYVDSTTADSLVINKIKLSPFTYYDWKVVPVNALGFADCGYGTYFQTIDMPYIQINSPKAGIYMAGGHSATIAFYNHNTGDYVNIDYSLDGGSTWTNATSGYNCYNGSSYSWTPPSVIGDYANCLIRIIATYNPSIGDTSDLFTIGDQSPILFTKPLVGSVVTENDTMLIELNNRGSDTYGYLYYSTDGGINYNHIQSMSVYPGTNTSLWIIPFVGAQSNVKLQFYDYYSAMYSYSNSFKINETPPYLTITSPTAGNTLQQNSLTSINWNGKGANSVNINYSIDGGSSWISIARNYSSVNGFNSYDWKVPEVGVLCNNCLISVSSSDSTLNDLSEAFSIPGPSLISFVRPKQGDLYFYNNNINVILNNSGSPTDVNLFYCDNDGRSLNGVIGTYSISSGLDTIIIPAGTLPQLYKGVFVIQNNSNSELTYSKTFRLLGQPYVNFNDPRSWYQYAWGKDMKIEWNGGSIARAKIQLYNPAIGYVTIADSFMCKDGLNMLNWQIPAGTGTVSGAQITITDLDRPEYTFYSDGFLISEPILELVYPVGKETFSAGQVMTLTYSTTDYSYIYLRFMADKVEKYSTYIYPNNIGVNTYQFNMPSNAFGDSCYFVLWHQYNSDPLNSAQNKYAFTISPPPPQLRIMTPYNGSYLNSGQQFKMEWESFFVDTIDVDYSIDGGSNWTNFATVVSPNNSYNYTNLTAPAVTGSQNNSKLRISNKSKTLQSISDVITISDVPRFEITNPTGSTVINAGANLPVNIVNHGAQTYYLYVYYEKIGYSAYNISYIYNVNTGLNTYNWKTGTDIEQGQYRIMVRDQNENYFYSDTFTINPAPPSLSLEAPNKDNYFFTGTYPGIYWRSVNVDSVIASYSLNGGTTWNFITEFKSNNSIRNEEYFFVDTTIKGTFKNSKIKVEMKGNPAVNSISQPFTMSSVAPDSFITPSAGSTIVAGTSIAIIFDNKGETFANLGKFSDPNSGLNLVYSIDSGSTWNMIMPLLKLTKGINSYTWTVPEGMQASNNFVIKLSWWGNNWGQVKVNLQAAPPSLAVTSPALNDYIMSSEPATIIWHSVNVPLVDIHFSADGGLTYNSIERGVASHNGDNYYYTSFTQVGTNSKYIIRVVSADETLVAYSELFTVSNRVPIIVVTPKGGEQVQAGSELLINYKMYPLSTNSVWIRAFSDEGYSYNIENKEVTKGTYSSIWKTDELTMPSSTYRIIVEGVFAGRYNSDTSNYFTLLPAPPRLAIQSPSDGQVFWSGYSVSVNYYAVNVPDVNIYLTTDSSLTWKNLKTYLYSYNGNNYYSFNPSIPFGEIAKNCHILITSAMDSTVNAISAAFTINNEAPVYTITSPKKGDVYQAGNYYTCAYTSTAKNNDYFDFSLSVDTGKTYFQVYPYSRYSIYGSDAFNFYIPDTIQAKTKCIVRMKSQSGSPTGLSDTFAITPASPYLGINQPNDQSWWIIGDSVDVTWYSRNIGAVKIQLSIDAGKTWAPITSSVTSKNGIENKYKFRIQPTQTASKYAIIKVASLDGKYVATSTMFNIASGAPYFSIVLPKGGETYKAGQNINFVFDNNGPSTPAGIEITYDGANWMPVSGNFNNYVSTGRKTFSIQIPENAPASDSARFRIYDMEGGVKGEAGGPETTMLVTLADTSEKFAITELAPYISVTEPGLNWIYYSGSNYSKVAWRSVHVNMVSIEYSSDNQANWTNLGNYQSYDGDNSANPYFVIPDLYSENSYYRITDVEKDTVVGLSQRFTTSNKPDTLFFYTPGGGEIVNAGSNLNISYLYQGRYRDNNRFDIYYSPDGGLNKMHIGNVQLNWGVSNMQWNLPWYLESTSNAVIIVEDYSYNASPLSIMSKPFTVVAAQPYINVQNPSSGDYWVTGKYYQIYWSSIKVPSFDVSMTPDGGKTWIAVADSLFNNNITVTAPVVTAPTDSAQIRVRASDSSLVAYSNYFTLSNVDPYIQITAPKNGDTYYANQTSTLKFINNGPAINKGIQLFLLDGNSGITSRLYLNYSSNYFAKGLNEVEFWFPETIYGTDKAKLILIAGKDNGYPTGGEISLVDTSDGYFNVVPAPPALYMEKPNSGSYFLGGTPAEIAWYDVNVGEVKLEYSANSGIDWSVIDSSITSSNGMNYYNWSVPVVSMENSNNLIRVTSTTNSTVNSVSQTFMISNIAPRLILTSPNGLVKWKAGNSYYVEFDYTGNTAYEAELAVSSDGGYTWQTVEYIYKIEKGKNFFLWNIPIYQEATPYYLMRIALDAQTFDVSDTTFTIEPGDAEIAINRPTADNGYLVSGTWDYITWNSALVQSADVDYSLDGGATWLSVYSSYPCYNGNNGIGWTLPAVTGVNGNAMIRIKDSSDPTIYALSNFTLSDRPGYISIIKPDSTTAWTAGNYYTVDFSSVGLPVNKPVKIKLKYNNRELWLNDEYNVQPGMNSFGFTLSDTLSASINAQIVITAMSDGTVAGYNGETSFFSNKFTINAASPSLTLNYPSTGSYLIKGDKANIYWYNVNAGRVNIDFSTDNGLTWTTIKSGFNGKNGYNSYEWIVPDLNITTAKIRITSIDVGGVEAISGSFTIFNGVVSLVLESPNGGETFNIGGTFKIRYSYNGGYRPIMLTFSSDSGLTWQPMEDAVLSKPGENVYSTNIPYDAQTSDNCLVSVADDRGNVDVSNAVFAIAPAIPVISVYQPKFGDRLMSGATYPISWYSLSVPFVNIAYSRDSANSWNTVVTHLPVFNIANTYNWTVPDTITGNNFSYIKVFNDDTVQGISELFTISSEAISFKVLQPNGGETILAETWQSIKFNYNGNNNLAVNLFISIDSGATWKQITNLTNSTALPGDNSFNIYIPYNLVSAKCKIRVQSATNPSLFDVSDNVFTIEGVAKSLLVTAPKFGSYLISGSSTKIEWNGYNVAQVKIEYSIDSAKTWNNVKDNVLSYNGKNVFNWTVPVVDTVRRFSFVKLSDVGIESQSSQFTLSDRYPSSDARLASLTVGGAVVDSFSSLKYNYTYFVTYSTKLPPALGGTPVDTFARINVTNSTVVPGTSFVDVTAEDGVTKKHYEVSFVKVSASNEAYLSSISLNGVPITGFQSGTYNYSFFYNYYDVIPVATATATSVGARVDITPATTIPGAITIVVTAESDTVWNTYTVNLTTNLPPSLSDATFSIDENTQNLTTVGTVTATNDKAVTIRYALLSNGGGAFKLLNNQGGVIQVNNFTMLNYEVTPTFTLKLRVYEISDPIKLADTATITVNLNNVNDLPIFNNQSIRIAENQPNNSKVGTISVIDEDVTHNYSFLLAGASYDGLFDINYQTGEIILLDSSLLNYAAFDANGIGNPVVLSVELFDDTFDITATVSINVLMMQDVAITIPEIPANGTVVSYVGDLDATEGDGGQNLTYSIVSGNTNNAFEINPSSGIISVLTPSEIDYEIVANRTFNLGIQISDDGTPSIALNKIVPVTITDVNDPPVTTDQVFRIFSFSLVGDTVGKVVASDEDAGDDLTYMISEEPVSGVFQIDQSTGMITVKAVKNLTLYSYFDLKVKITDNGLPGTTKLSATAGIRINVNSGVIADFTYMIDGDDPKKVTFTNQSSVNAKNFWWTFGDGTTFVGKTILHTYGKAGLYDVCLTVSDPDRGVTDKICKKVQIGEPKCTMFADFTFGMEGDTIILTDHSNGAIEHWYWSFGDDVTSSDQNPIHKYAVPGFYLVSLSVSDSLRSCTDYYAEMIQVGQVECHANFDYIGDSLNAMKVIFTNKSEGVNLQYYYWDFGDGKYSVAENSANTYRKNGIYTASLTVSNSTASCMDVYEVPVQIGSMDCNAKFNYTVDTATNMVYFTEVNLNESTNILWSFGDGRFSVNHEPSHQYKFQGFYTVSVNSYNKASGCMDYYEDVILVGAEGADCEADFMAQINPTSMNVQFADNSKGNIEFYIWNYGDGVKNTNLADANPDHTYKVAGFYNVCLMVINTNDISNITCKKIGVGTTEQNSLEANFDFNIDTFDVTFKDNSVGSPDKWQWNFGDKSAIDTTETPSHTYSSDGYYLVSLKVTNTSSNRSDKTYKMININSNDLGLKAGFGYDAKPYDKKAGGYPVDFIGAGCGDQARLQWSFDDGESDTTTNTPTHTYSDTGTYDVCYTVSDPVTGESDKFCDKVTTTTLCQSDLEPPVALCKNITVTLDNQNKATIDASMVDNGSLDGCGINIYSIDKSSFTNANLGANNVKLTVTDFSGNDSTCVATVTVQSGIFVPTENMAVNFTAFPNPFDKLTTISFNLDSKSTVELAVLDLSGKRIATILRTTKDRGFNSIKWDGAGLESGTYILQLRTANSVSTRMIVKK